MAEFGSYYNAAITPADEDIILLADASNSNKVEGVHIEDLPVALATQAVLDGKVSKHGQIKYVGEGQTIQSVIDAITDADATNQYIIIIPPRVYIENLNAKAYVHLEFNEGAWLKPSAPGSTAIQWNCTNGGVLRIIRPQIEAYLGISVVRSGSPDVSEILISDPYLIVTHGGITALRPNTYVKIYNPIIQIKDSTAQANGVIARAGANIWVFNPIITNHRDDASLDNVEFVDGFRSHLNGGSKIWVFNPLVSLVAGSGIECNGFYVDGDSECYCFGGEILTSGSDNAYDFFQSEEGVLDVYGTKYTTSSGIISGKHDAEDETAVGTYTLNPSGVTKIDSSAGAVTGTLGDGHYIGQRKHIVMTDTTNSSTVSVTNHETSNPEIGTFDAVDEVWILEWSGNEWLTIKASCTL